MDLVSVAPTNAALTLPSSDYSSVLNTYTIANDDPVVVAISEGVRSAIQEVAELSNTKAKEYNKMAPSRSADVEVLCLHVRKFADPTKSEPPSTTYQVKYMNAKRCAKNEKGEDCEGSASALELPPNIYYRWGLEHTSGDLLYVQYTIRWFDERARRMKQGLKEAQDSKDKDRIQKQKASLNTIIPDLASAALSKAVRAQYLPFCTYANVLSYAPNSIQYKGKPGSKIVYAQAPAENLEAIVKDALTRTSVADTVASLLYTTHIYSQHIRLSSQEVFNAKPASAEGLEECSMGIMQLSELECSISITPSLMLPTFQQLSNPDDPNVILTPQHNVGKFFGYKSHIVKLHIDPDVWLEYAKGKMLFTQMLQSPDSVGQLDVDTPAVQQLRLLVVPHSAVSHLYRRIRAGIETHFNISSPLQKHDDPHIFCTTDSNNKKSRICSRMQLVGIQWQQRIIEPIEDSDAQRIFIQRAQHLVVNLDLWCNHLAHFGLHESEDVPTWKKLAPIFLYNAEMLVNCTVDATRSLQLMSRKHLLETPYTPQQTDFIESHKDVDYMNDHTADGTVLRCDTMDDVSEAMQLATRNTCTFTNLAVSVDSVVYDAAAIIRRSGFLVSKKVANIILAKMPLTSRPKGTPTPTVRILTTDKAINDLDERQFDIVAVNIQTKDREYLQLPRLTVRETDLLLHPDFKSKNPAKVEEHLVKNEVDPKLVQISCFADISNTYLFAVKKKDENAYAKKMTAILQYLQPTTTTKTSASGATESVNALPPKQPMLALEAASELPEQPPIEHLPEYDDVMGAQPTFDDLDYSAEVAAEPKSPPVTTTTTTTTTTKTSGKRKTRTTNPPLPKSKRHKTHETMDTEDSQFPDD